MDSFLVLKFGGSSFNVGGYNTIAEQIRKNVGNIIVVVSAIGNTTDLLYNIINQENDTYHDIFTLHQDLCINLNLSFERVEEVLLSLYTDILNYMQNALLDITQHKIKIIKYGEILSSIVLHEYLSNEFNTRLITASNFIISNNSYKNIDPITLEQKGEFFCDKNKLMFLFNKHTQVYVTQGFIASTIDNRSCILTRSGSDTTAALIASSINAERLEIWTDVDGIFTADPRIVGDAKIIKCLNYDVCQELAAWGTKVVHPYCIKPCQKANIPIYIRNTNNVDSDTFTKVTSCNRSKTNNVYSIVNQKDITVYEIESHNMWQNWGFVKDIFEVFTKYNIDVNIVTTSLFSITTTTDEKSDIKKRQTLQELQTRYNVNMIEGCSIISLITNDVLENTGLSSSLEIINSVGREYLYITHYSANNMSLSYVVDSIVSDKITRMFHRKFIERDLNIKDNLDIWWRCRTNRLIDIFNKNENKPMYIYNLYDIKEKCIRLREKLSKVKYFYYAMKANDNIDVIKTIIEQGYNIECVSIEEVRFIREFSGVKILYTPNYCGIDDYIEALTHENIQIVVDNYEIVRDNIDVFKNHKIGLRIDLDCGDGHHEKVVTEGDHVKFGMPISDIPKLIDICNINFLHTHKGSGILNFGVWGDTLVRLKGLIEMFPNLDTIDLGGGFGVWTNGNELDLDKVNDYLDEIDIDLAVEPGRYLVSESGILLSKVNQIRSKGIYNYMGIDIGMNALIRPMLYDAYHPIYNLTKMEEIPDMYYSIVGPICESGDILGKKRLLPNTDIDDIILIENAGAYGRVMASTYNMSNIPIEYIIEE